MTPPLSERLTDEQIDEEFEAACNVQSSGRFFGGRS